MAMKVHRGGGFLASDILLPSTSSSDVNSTLSGARPVVERVAAGTSLKMPPINLPGTTHAGSSENSITTGGDSGCRIRIYRALDELIPPLRAGGAKTLTTWSTPDRQVAMAAEDIDDGAAAEDKPRLQSTAAQLPEWVFQTVGHSARIRICRASRTRGGGGGGGERRTKTKRENKPHGGNEAVESRPRTEKKQDPQPAIESRTPAQRRGGSSNQIIITPRLSLEYNPAPANPFFQRPLSRHHHLGRDSRNTRMPPLSAPAPLTSRPPWRLDHAKPDPPISLRVLTDEMVGDEKEVMAQRRCKTAADAATANVFERTTMRPLTTPGLKMPPLVVIPPMTPAAAAVRAVPRELAFLLTRRVFGYGGDIRSAINGTLLYSIQCRRTAQTTSLFLLDTVGRTIWKITERPGTTCGNNYDMYGRGKTAACGAAGWVLRGMVDRRSSNLWAPKLELKWNGASIIMLGDYAGHHFQYRSTCNGSHITGTFGMQQEPSSHAVEPSQSPPPLHLTQPAPPTPPPPPPCPDRESVFPEKWDLRINAAYLPHHGRGGTAPALSRAATPPSGALHPFPPEMYVAAALVVQYFLREEREAVSRV
ncbi:hypothetical protein DFJ77DRAFT_363 [Powellomyces hirtus]|nr:hypothetical protein DFJ77DRAFT_363 [Powellomyces hirtus]